MRAKRIHIWGYALILHMLFSFSVSAEPSKKAFSQGSYHEPLLSFECTRDAAQYGTHYEGSTQESALSHYCGQANIPAGYWVYQKPNWTIYRTLKLRPALERAALGGKYSGLLQIVDCPQEHASEASLYGLFYDYGWEPATVYCGREYPGAYWVFASPKWYLWQKKDLAAIGFAQKQRRVSLPSGKTLHLRIEYAQGHELWSKNTLDVLEKGIHSFTRWSGQPFPGEQPYLIEERPNFELLGMASRSKMMLSSPPRGSSWTLLHEMVHIWNVDVEPLWYNEGLANFLSYLMMKEQKLPFHQNETWEAYLSDWESIRGGASDLPLWGHYNQLPQGKAMAFWQRLYDLGGPDLIRESFLLGQREKQVSLSAFRSLLSKYVKSPNQLLSGWVLEGPYLD